MVIRTRDGGNVELRADFNFLASLPPPRLPISSSAGVFVSRDAAVGLPALGSAVRLIAGIVAATPILVFSGRKDSKRLVEGTWQEALFNAPQLGVSDYDWRWDLAATLESTENWVALKHRSRGKVTELEPLDIDNVRIRWDQKTRQKLFDIGDFTSYQTYGTDLILHVRGQTIKGGHVGVSRIQQHRDPVGVALAGQVFEGDYFKNSGVPTFFYTGAGNRKQAEELLDAHNQRHQGGGKQFKVGAVWGNMDVKPIPVSMADAQFVEAKGFNVQEIARIMDVSAPLLGHLDLRTDVKAELDRFQTLQLLPRLRRIERAFYADPDLFGQAMNYPQFDIPDLFLSDPLTKAQVNHFKIQNGSLLVDEARAEEGRPPLPGGLGQVPQLTPVGGAPNPDPLPSIPQE